MVKVLKFGGTSVGSAQNLRQVQQIIAREKQTSNTPLVVVASAVGGITDLLYQTAQDAIAGGDVWETRYREICECHSDLIRQILSSIEISSIVSQVSLLEDELFNLYKGLSLIRDLSDKTLKTILSYGERISAIFLTSFLHATFMDARDLVFTHKGVNGKDILDSHATNTAISNAFSSFPQLTLVSGFIASDAKTGEITNLGRGGSDYTAAIIAATLDAQVLEIWTDVDGFMTADPHVISKAYTISHLSYTEAMELSNFGAKVLYPPTVYPAYKRNIPIYIKNTTHPEHLGTCISSAPNNSDKSIKGISSIPDTTLITIQGMGLVAIDSANSRIFQALSRVGVSAFFIAQSSSGTSISFGVLGKDDELAVSSLRQEFATEISTDEISDIQFEQHLATIAIVGDNMRQATGTAGKLFNTLGRNNINVVAVAQGVSETNISCVVKNSDLRKALNSIHESFFLSEFQELNLFVVGTGTVGDSLLQQLRTQHDMILKQNALNIKVIGIAESRRYILNRDGLDLSNFREQLQTNAQPSSPEVLKQVIFDLNIYNCVFVDCTASADIAKLYRDFLLRNISVVAANKIAASSSYSQYIELKEIARSKGVKFLFETNVGAGLPIINTINSLVYSGDRILKLEAVLSGTLNFVFNTISEDIPLSKAIRLAMEAKFAEPDPRIDLSGKDVIRKLVILTRESGYIVEESDVEKNLFLPDSCFNGSLEDFWQQVESLDAEFETKRQILERDQMRLRFIATMENGHTSVGLRAVDVHHPFYDLEGSNNIILLTTERYKQYPMMIRGYGAGADVTAAGVFADIISIANIR